jgi:hypothetical protein
MPRAEVEIAGDRDSIWLTEHLPFFNVNTILFNLMDAR